MPPVVSCELDRRTAKFVFVEEIDGAQTGHQRLSSRSAATAEYQEHQRGNHANEQYFHRSGSLLTSPMISLLERLADATGELAAGDRFG